MTPHPPELVKRVEAALVAVANEATKPWSAMARLALDLAERAARGVMREGLLPDEAVRRAVADEGGGA